MNFLHRASYFIFLATVPKYGYQDQEPTPINCPIFKEHAIVLPRLRRCLSSEGAHYTASNYYVNHFKQISSKQFTLACIKTQNTNHQNSLVAGTGFEPVTFGL